MSSPQRVAAYLLANTDVVGFGIVVQRQDYRAGRREIVDIAFPLKGEPGERQMAFPYRDGTIAVSNHSTTFDAEAGFLVLAALQVQADGAVIGECSQRLLAAFPTRQLIGALYEVASSSRR